jgi:alanine-glyoxylate transaminase/serine-glyoxylate transaminase/serine-pyruvate transaminase
VISVAYDAWVSLTERVLMGPGPCNPYPEVLLAMAQPVLGHLDPLFLALMDETSERLRQVFKTQNALTFPLSGTGSAGMEASFVNFVSPGDVVVIGVNGVFGERMCEVAARAGGEVVRVEASWGQPIDPERLVGAHPEPSVIAVVHAETSTGVRNDVAGLAGLARELPSDPLIVVDTVTSLGGIEVDVDGWGVDVAYAGTQKCLGVPPGLAPITVSERARLRQLERPRSWYLDIGLISRYVEASPGGRVYHHTAPVSMVAGLHAGLGVILEEGLEHSWERHQSCGEMLQKGLEELGLELFAAQGHRLPELTTVLVPERRLSGKSEAEVRANLLQRYGIEIGGGLGAFAGKMWRIGLMGFTAQERNVALLLAALAEELDS